MSSAENGRRIYPIIMENKIICYGAGTQGQQVKRMLEGLGLKLDFFADKNLSVISRVAIDGVKIISIEELNELDKQIPIIIGIGVHKKEVIEEIDTMLVRMGFANIFYSAIEMVEVFYPELQKKEIYFYDVFDITTNIGCSINCRYCPQKLLISRYKQHINFTGGGGGKRQIFYDDVRDV
jgi:hypothetical protein